MDELTKPRPLTRTQVERLETLLPAGYAVVGGMEASPLLEQPDGRLVLLKSNGRLVRTRQIARTQSYLRVARC